MSGTAADRPRSTRAAGTAIQKFALAMGIVFLVVGVAGFIPGLTSNVDQLQFASHHSTAALLGVFQVSVLHNIVHLLFGVVGLVAARTAHASRLFLIVGGVIYLVLFIYGLIVPHDSAANFVPINTADNVLHIALAAVMIIAGLALSRSRAGVTAEAADGRR
jgi:arginine exporter protein ArgO